MNRNETIQNLTEGRDHDLIGWLSLEDWDTLPIEDQMDDINAAWDAFGDDTDGFARYVRHLMGEDTVTATEVYDDLIHDADARRQIISYGFPEGEYEYVKALEDRYDVAGQVIQDALHMVRANWRTNF